MENNWTEICAKCMEGDIEPHYCEYYGEPNGCNSPTYGKHPPTPSAAAMYSCLVKILAEMIDLGGIERGKKAYFSPDAIADEIRQALAAPPRNCDVGTVEQQAKRFAEYCESEVCKRNRCKSRAKALCIERCALAWEGCPTRKEARRDDTNTRASRGIVQNAKTPATGGARHTASFGALASMLRSMSHNFRCESSASVRNIQPVDCDMLAELFDEIANRLDELVSVVSRREEGGAK